ncbi:MAG: hypothetical protein AAB965_03165 [Patescibacteria group bacterium]
MLDYLWAILAYILGAVFKIKRYQTRAYGSEDAIIGLRNPGLANLARTNRLLHLWGCPPLLKEQYEFLVQKSK